MLNEKFKCGMVSVTFRKYSVDEIIASAVRAGLDGIEWGGDIHVPQGDIGRAAYAAAACAEAGLEIFSYGSYYRAGQGQDFMPVLQTAAALRAPNIRIWAGAKGSADTQRNERADITADIQSCAGLSAAYGITVTFEYHSGTLTDDPDSAVRLISEVNYPNVLLYWQPDQFKPVEYNTAALKKVLPYLLNVHVFSWENKYKYPLSEGYDTWLKYLDIIKSDGKPHGLLLEFSPDDTEDTFLRDAETLRKLIGVQ
jgi:sugar phosphate isomerase/epimerase